MLIYLFFAGLDNTQVAVEGIATQKDNDTSNDLILAQMLQAKLDKEYNQYLSRQEQHVNRDSKVIFILKLFLLQCS